MTVPMADPRVDTALRPFEQWDGSTYYGRQQLKPWPFEPQVVGGYIFLAGLSGSSAILAATASASGRRELDGVIRRGRYLSLLAPTLGAALLVYDLHTPKRFYNMLRVAKATSPMSIGTWTLMGFSAAAFTAAVGQAGADRWPRRRWTSRMANAAGLPAALAGAGLSTYTAALLAATSAPAWAAAPKALAVRFAASSIASGAAALALGEGQPDVRGKLDLIQGGALCTEALAAIVMKREIERAGVEGAYDSAAGTVEKLGATGLGMAMPLALLALSALLPRRPRALSIVAGVATLAGSAVLRTSMLDIGSVSAKRPDVSFRFSTPRNLPGR